MYRVIESVNRQLESSKRKGETDGKLDVKDGNKEDRGDLQVLQERNWEAKSVHLTQRAMPSQ